MKQVSRRVQQIKAKVERLTCLSGGKTTGKKKKTKKNNLSNQYNYFYN